MKDKTFKISEKILFLYAVSLSMWIGSSIQLYSVLLSQITLPDKFTIWHKILGFALFFSLDDYKGTFSEFLGNISKFMFVLVFVSISVCMFADGIEKKKNKECQKLL